MNAKRPLKQKSSRVYVIIVRIVFKSEKPLYMKPNHEKLKIFRIIPHA